MSKDLFDDIKEYLQLDFISDIKTRDKKRADGTHSKNTGRKLCSRPVA